MPVKYKRSISLKDLNDNPDFLYLYCENAERFGDDDGLAKFRGEENAVGIRLKYRPGNGRSPHIDEDNSFEGQAFVDEDLDPLFTHVRAGGTVVIPSIGFVPARLCETVRDYLLEQLERLSDEDRTG